MGAWGHGHFENDSAFDFMNDLEDAANPKELISDALDEAINGDYLEVDEGSAAVVAAAYVDAQVHGTKFSSVDADEPLAIDTFALRHPTVNLTDLQSKAVRALKQVLADDSELRELWEENEEDYPAWRKGIKQLMQRLKQR